MIESARVAEEIQVYIYTIVAAFISSMVEVFNHRYAEKLQMRTLSKLLLHEKWEWRTLKALRRAIRKDESTTRELLNRLGARANTGRKEVWTLKDD